MTDRVVNQLLCELDGIESLQGVFVLAASNRPELIDPALLRPGRIDRKLFCALPDLDARDAILRALLRKVRCEASLQSASTTRALAARCDGYSGADLQALLANAQLAAVHESLAREALNLNGTSMGADACAPVDAPLSGDQLLRVRAAVHPTHPWLHAPDEWPKPRYV